MTTEQATSPGGRIPNLGVRVLRLVRHEWTLAILGGLLLSVVMTWPTLRDITRTIPQDLGDPTLQAWQIAWGGHALLTDPLQLWHSNTFYPEPYTYAYSDTLLGYAPFAMIGEGPVAAVVRYNILYVLAHALAFIGAYALSRQLGANWIGAAVAGAAFGFAPWKLAQAGHLHVLSIGGIALSLAMLARGHGWSLRYGYRPERTRPGWTLAGWLVAAWQITLGFGVGLPFGYALALICLGAGVGYLWSWWRRSARPPFGRRLFLADLVGGVIFSGVTIFMALPYLEVVARHPQGRRTLAHIEQFSPPLKGFLLAPPESWLWGERHAAARESLSFAGEMTLLPGVTLIGLAFAGLFFSAWRLRHRLVLAAAVLVTIALAMGTQFGNDGHPGYATLIMYVPGWDGIRTSGRLVVWTTLLLGVLAAGALSTISLRPGRSEEPAPTEPTTEPGSAVESGPTVATEPAAETEPAAATELAAATEPAGSAAPAGKADSPAAVSSDPAAGAEPAVESTGVTVARLRPSVPPLPAEPAVDEPARDRTPGARAWLVRLVALIPLALVILEGVNKTPHVPVFPQPAALQNVQDPLLILPANAGTLEFTYMLWSTDGFPRMVNGLASFMPASQATTYGVVATFPDAGSVNYLRQLGIRTVVVLSDFAGGTAWQDAATRPIDGLGIQREQVGNAVVFRLG